MGYIETGKAVRMDCLQIIYKEKNTPITTKKSKKRNNSMNCLIGKRRMEMLDRIQES